jgi:hypothetical protein
MMFKVSGIVELFVEASNSETATTKVVNDLGCMPYSGSNHVADVVIPYELQAEAVDRATLTETVELLPDGAGGKVVYSTRIDPRFSDRLAAEADRCGRNPLQLIGDLVSEALERRESANRPG